MTTDTTNTTDTPAPKFVQFGGEGSIAGVDSESIMRTIQEIERQARTKVDIVVAADRCNAVIRSAPPVDNEARFEMALEIPIPDASWLSNARYTMSINEYAHAQLATHLGITKTYYDRMRTSDDSQTLNLLVTNVNHWLQRYGKRFMVRTLDNHVRAFMSDSYKPRDNFDLVNAVLEPISESGAQITRLDLTERRMYIRALHPEWKERVERQNLDVQTREQIFQSWMADLKADDEGNIPYFSRQDPNHMLGDGGFGLRSDWDDDWIIPGVVIQNSEIGQGMTTVAPFALRQICMNGTVMDATIAVRHVGSNASVLDGFLSPETIKQENALVWAQMRDITRATFDPALFKQMVEKMNQAANELIQHPVEAVDRAIGQFDIDKNLRQQLLNQLVAGGDPTKWGLLNAVTAVAQRQEDFDDRMHLETVGGRMLELVRVR